MFALLLLLPVVCLSQKNDTTYSVDTYGLPLAKFLEGDSLHHVHVMRDGTHVKVRILGVEFQGGRDSLNSYVMAAYYRQVGYDYCDYQQMIPFLILLDKDLQVREVRQMGPEFLCKEERNYKLFTDILMGTSGKWDKIVDGEDWYQYLCVIRHY